MTGLIIFFIIMGVFLPLLVFAVAGDDIADAIGRRRRRNAISHSPSKALPKKERSDAANHIVKRYDALPEVNRPALNIAEAVEALDIKYGIKDVNAHFVDSQSDYMYLFDGYAFSWFCDCRVRNTDKYPYHLARKLGLYDKKKDCKKYPEYLTLARELERIDEAVKEQAHAIEIAAVKPALDDIDHIRQTLRAEQELVRSVTQELTEGR